MLLLGFFVPFLWLFGLHGSAMVNGLVSPVLQANSLANAEILASGQELTDKAVSIDNVGIRRKIGVAATTVVALFR
ncbi:hypothetical protein EfmAA55_23470 [Enterococcus faecium]|nr:hypothetical protein EfmAA55_23470 [Enterococcus faecium]